MLTGMEELGLSARKGGGMQSISSWEAGESSWRGTLSRHVGPAARPDAAGPWRYRPSCRLPLRRRAAAGWAAAAALVAPCCPTYRDGKAVWRQASMLIRMIALSRSDAA